MRRTRMPATDRSTTVRPRLRSPAPSRPTDHSTTIEAAACGWRAIAGSAVDSCEHALVFRQHDVPLIVAAGIVAGVGAPCGPQGLVGDQQLQTLHELVAVRVIQTGVAADAVLDQ